MWCSGDIQIQLVKDNALRTLDARGWTVSSDTIYLLDMSGVALRNQGLDHAGDRFEGNQPS